MAEVVEHIGPTATTSPDGWAVVDYRIRREDGEVLPRRGSLLAEQAPLLPAGGRQTLMLLRRCARMRAIAGRSVRRAVGLPATTRLVAMISIWFDPADEGNSLAVRSATSALSAWVSPARTGSGSGQRRGGHSTDQARGWSAQRLGGRLEISEPGDQRRVEQLAAYPPRLSRPVRGRRTRLSSRTRLEASR